MVGGDGFGRCVWLTLIGAGGFLNIADLVALLEYAVCFRTPVGYGLLVDMGALLLWQPFH